MRQRIFCLSLKDVKLKSDGVPFFITVCEGHICRTSFTKTRRDSDAKTAFVVARTTWQKATKSILFYAQYTFMSLHIVITLYHNYYRCSIGFYAVNKIAQAVMALLGTNFNFLLSTTLLCCHAELYYPYMNYYLNAIRLFCTLFFDCVSHFWWLNP